MQEVGKSSTWLILGMTLKRVYVSFYKLKQRVPSSDIWKHEILLSLWERVGCEHQHRPAYKLRGESDARAYLDRIDDAGVGRHGNRMPSSGC